MRYDDVMAALKNPHLCRKGEEVTRIQSMTMRGLHTLPLVVG